MHDLVFIALLVSGIVAAVALIWVPVIVWFVRRGRAATTRLAGALTAEGVVRAPEKAVYRGATAPSYPKMSNSGRIALTAQHLLFATLTGKLIEVPVGEITGIRQAKAFRGSVVAGRTHVVVAVPDGELGFHVGDNADWIAALTGAASGAS